MNFLLSIYKPEVPAALGLERPSAEAALQLAAEYESKGYVVKITAPNGDELSVADLQALTSVRNNH